MQGKLPPLVVEAEHCASELLSLRAELYLLSVVTGPEGDAPPIPAEPPAITLGPLEKSGVDELSDGVQSMDVR